MPEPLWRETTSSAMNWNGGRSTRWPPLTSRTVRALPVTASTARGRRAPGLGRCGSPWPERQVTLTPSAHGGVGLVFFGGLLIVENCTQLKSLVTATSNCPGLRYPTAYRPAGPPVTWTGAVARCGLNTARNAAAAASVPAGSLHAHAGSLSITTPRRFLNAATTRCWASVSSCGFREDEQPVAGELALLQLVVVDDADRNTVLGQHLVGPDQRPQHLLPHRQVIGPAFVAAAFPEVDGGPAKRLRACEVGRHDLSEGKGLLQPLDRRLASVVLLLAKAAFPGVHVRDRAEGQEAGGESHGLVLVRDSRMPDMRRAALGAVAQHRPAQRLPHVPRRLLEDVVGVCLEDALVDPGMERLLVLVLRRVGDPRQPRRHPAVHQGGEVVDADHEDDVGVPSLYLVAPVGERRLDLARPEVQEFEIPRGGLFPLRGRGRRRLPVSARQASSSAERQHPSRGRCR